MTGLAAVDDAYVCRVRFARPGGPKNWRRRCGRASRPLIHRGGHSFRTAAPSITLGHGDALRSGRYLAIWGAIDTDPAHVNAVQLYNKSGAPPWQLRSRDQITRLLDGLDLIDPGVVSIQEWRPDPDPGATPAVDAWGGLARKPADEEHSPPSASSGHGQRALPPIGRPFSA